MPLTAIMPRDPGTQVILLTCGCRVVIGSCPRDPPGEWTQSSPCECEMGRLMSKIDYVRRDRACNRLFCPQPLKK